MSNVLWTPEVIATALWLDAADSDTITLVSGAVSEWRDKSGNTRHATQGAADKRPLIALNSLNALNIVEFDGVNDNLSSSLVSNQPISYLVVARTSVATGSSGSRQYIVDSQSIGGIDRTVISLRGNQTNYPSIWAGTWLQHSTATSTSWVLCVATFSGANSVIGVNGSNVYGSAGTAPLATGLRIGCNYLTDADFLSGGIAEIVAITGALTTEERFLIEGYLAHKWGLAANLPSDHPYKTAAPTIPVLSGVVTVNSSPAQRTVLVYKNDDADLFMSTQSDATTGEWQVVVSGEETDRYRVVMVGESGEYSKVFEDVTAG